MKSKLYVFSLVALVMMASCAKEIKTYKTAAKAAFTVSGTMEVGETISFTDGTTLGSGSSITNYLWSFGDADNTTSTEKNPTFVFKKDGTFKVVLTVTDDNGLTASASEDLTIKNPTVADFTTDNTEYAIGETVKFTDASATKGSTTITAWEWNFGDEDNSTATEKNPTFKYKAAGAYNVTLKVTDSYGLTASTKKSVSVYDPSQMIATKWSAAVPGAIKGGSSPAVSADGSVVYILTSAAGSDNAALRAYNTADGSLKWSLDLDQAMKDHHDGASTAAGAKDVFGSPSVGADGNIYFVVRDLKDSGATRRLFVFAVKPDGSVAWAYAGADKNVYAVTPAIDASGNIYVVDRGPRVWKFTASGEQTDLAATGMVQATGGLSISKSGILYGKGNGANGLFAYDVNSKSVSYIYKEGFGGASSAFTGALGSANISIGTDGTVYSVTDCTTGGKVFALKADGTEKWAYATPGANADGGVVIGADGTLYACGGKYSGENSAGVIALNSDGTLKWHYATEEDVVTTPLIDNRGYVHFVSSKGTYGLLNATGNLISSQDLGDSTQSTLVMGNNGNVYLWVVTGDETSLVCVTSKASTYADCPWPMKGQNPQRTGLQK